MSKRFDLIPAKAMSGVAKVFNQGIIQGKSDYDWRNKGTMELINKLKEKLNDFENMVDKDDDGIYNIDKVAAYAMMIHDTLSNAPHYDDRNAFNTNHQPRISLDVDDVVADFLGTYQKKYNENISPYWQCDYDMPSNLKEVMKDETFWENLPVLHRPNFEPACYISSRSIPVAFTQKFIKKAGLPCAPVYHVPWNESKVEVLKANKIDIHIDDKVQNFLEATNAGIFCYLMDAPHNRDFDDKGRRIFNLQLGK